MNFSSYKVIYFIIYLYNFIQIIKLIQGMNYNSNINKYGMQQKNTILNTVIQSVIAREFVCGINVHVFSPMAKHVKISANSLIAYFAKIANNV